MSEPTPLEAIFFAALAKAPAERAAYLNEACAGDEDLRRRAERMVAAQAEAGSFLESPPSAVVVDTGPTTDQPPPVRPGTQIGPYKLIEQIGEGGMGTVWMAQQAEPVKRVVALKLIKAGMDSRQVIARFEAERQALALMDHPNIARVLDAGTTDAGRPYFVMDLVRGVPITRYCDEHHLTPRQRLELFIPVCQAIQHAHQKGIIHRDLKPSNVLVALYDGKPVPKVIDFGVAKATGPSLTDKTLVTGFGNIVGTLEYMSPEQAEINQLDIDTRSDIYSLGVLLYELLTGSTPFSRKELEQAGMLEMLRVIREEEPSKPSTKLSSSDALPTLSANRGTEPAKLTKLVRGELDWIVMKALEKDRSRRYETAGNFAADIQHYLNDEAVVACPPSAGYRFRKFARRNKGRLVAAIILAVALLVAVSGIGWAVRDRQAREADIARERSQRQQRLTAQVDLIVAEVERLQREQKWAEALSAVRRAEAALAGGEADAATTQRVRELLKDLEFIDRLEQIRSERATIVEETFDYIGAEGEYARAFRAYGVEIDEVPSETAIERLKARSALAIPLAAALDDWVHARRLAGDSDVAGRKRLVAVARAIDPDPLRDRLRSKWGAPVSQEVQDELSQLAESIDVRAQHPATLVSLAHALQQSQESDSAIRLLRSAQHVFPGDFWINFNLGVALSNQPSQQSREEAIRYQTAALSIRPQSVGAHTQLAWELQTMGRWDQAITTLEEAMRLQPKHTYAANKLVWLLANCKDPKFRDTTRAVELARHIIELDPANINYHNSLGMAHYRAGNWNAAREALEKSTEVRKGGDGFDWFLLAMTHARLGDQQQAQMWYAKAAQWTDEKQPQNDYLLRLRAEAAAETYQSAAGHDQNGAVAYHTLGVALSRRNKLDQAVAAFREAIRLDPTLKEAHIRLAWALQRMGRFPEAIATYEEAIRLFPEEADATNNLIWLLATCPDSKCRNTTRAVELAQQAVERDPTNVNYPNTLGMSHYRAGNWQAAIEALDKSLEVRKGGDGFDWLFLAMAHWQLGDKQAAHKWHRQAVAWMKANPTHNQDLGRIQAEAESLLKIIDDKSEPQASK